MDYRTELLNMINKFNIESVEEFKEAEMLIVRDSKFKSIRKMFRSRLPRKFKKRYKNMVAKKFGIKWV